MIGMYKPNQYKTVWCLPCDSYEYGNCCLNNMPPFPCLELSLIYQWKMKKRKGNGQQISDIESKCTKYNRKLCLPSPRSSFLSILHIYPPFLLFMCFLYIHSLHIHFLTNYFKLFSSPGSIKCFFAGDPTSSVTHLSSKTRKISTKLLSLSLSWSFFSLCHRKKHCLYLIALDKAVEPIKQQLKARSSFIFLYHAYVLHIK
jgi:hypothetical protein